ncbi:MAG: preprotein translocase subunit SecG [Gammaproteobacteria bacterium]|jgi:preprotein translocase subunit SecG
MSFQIVLIIHVLLALSLVSIILIQHGKGADAGAAFGSGAAGAVFGARGAHSFLYKLTSGLAIGFFITSIFLAYLATSETTVSPSSQQSIMSEVTTIESELPVSDIPSN